METFSDMIAAVGNRVQNTSTAAATILKTMMNSNYKDLWGRYPWPELNVWDTAVTTTANSAYLVLPRDVGHVLTLSDRANGIDLSGVSGENLVRGNITTLSSTGTPFEYAVAGEVGVLTQPTSASVVTVVSASAADTTPLAVRVWGISSGVRASQSITLTGTTPAAGTTSFTTVERLSTSGTTTGVVTATSNSGAVTLAKIGPTERTSRYLQIRLEYTPSSAQTLYVSYKKRYAPLVYDEDVPEMDVCSALREFTEADWLQRQGQYQKATAIRQQAEQSMREALVARAVFQDGMELSMPYYGRSNFNVPDVYGTGGSGRY